MRKHKLYLKARIEYDIEMRKAREASLELIDLLLEIVENERDVLLAEIEYERTHCSVCNHPWTEHDFGVPAPLCP